MSEEKDFNEVLDKAKELEVIDFNSTDSNFDYVEYYKAIEKIAKKNQTIKNDEAENVIKEFGEKYIDKDFIVELNNRRKSVEDFIRKFDPNKDEVKSITNEHDIDKIYAISNYLLNSYIQYINEMGFTFELSKTEIQFINKLLTSEIEYNGDEVFNFVELYENFWKKTYAFFTDNKSNETFTFKINIKMILILHHLIKDHKVKGKTNDFITFRNILFKIAQTNKLFNAYSIIIERIKADRELWGNALDFMITEGKAAEDIKTVEEKLEKPKKSKKE